MTSDTHDHGGDRPHFTALEHGDSRFGWQRASVARDHHRDDDHDDDHGQDHDHDDSGTPVDTTPPTANLSAVTDTVGPITGALANGAVTDDASLTLTGTCEAGSTVAIYDNGVQIGTAVVSGTTWTFEAPVADGVTSSFTVTETDAAGNQSTPTTAFTVTGDMTAPTATITADTALVTMDTPLTLTVTFSEAVTGFNAADISIAGATQTAASASADGLTWQITFAPDPNLQATGVTVDVASVAADLAGNGLIVAATPVLDFDTRPTAFAGTITAGPVIDPAALSVLVFDATGTQIGTGTVNPDGTYSVTTAGAYTGPALIQVVDTTPTADYMDEATGTPMDLVGDLRAVIDITGPGTVIANVNPLTELAVQALGLAGGDGGAAATALTGLTAPQVAGAVATVEAAFGMAPGDLLAGAVATTINPDGTPNAAANAYGTALAAISGMEANTGLTTAQITAQLGADLADGTFSAASLQALVAGAAVAGADVAGLATALGYVDTTAPTVQPFAVTDDAGSITGPLADGGVTDDASLTLTGTCEAGSTVQIHDNGVLIGSATVSGTTWTFEAPVTDGATSALTVTETDAMGNASAPSTAFTVTGDMTGPDLTITDNLNGGVATGNVDFTFSFSEDTFNFDMTDIAVTGGTVTAVTQDATDASQYTVTVATDADPTTMVTLDVANGVANDTAGNGNTAAHWQGGDGPAGPVATTVVFDFVTGQSSSYGNNNFDPNVTYDIYIRASGPTALPDTSITQWGNWGALGADDRIIFVGAAKGDGLVDSRSSLVSTPSYTHSGTMGIADATALSGWSFFSATNPANPGAGANHGYYVISGGATSTYQTWYGNFSSGGAWLSSYLGTATNFSQYFSFAASGAAGSSGIVTMWWMVTNFEWSTNVTLGTVGTQGFQNVAMTGTGNIGSIDMPQVEIATAYDPLIWASAGLV